VNKRLGSLKTAFWTFIGSAELSAFLASPDYDFSAVWAWKLDSLGSGLNYSVAAITFWHFNV